MGVSEFLQGDAQGEEQANGGDTVGDVSAQAAAGEPGESAATDAPAAAPAANDDKESGLVEAALPPPDASVPVSTSALFREVAAKLKTKPDADAMRAFVDERLFVQLVAPSNEPLPKSRVAVLCLHVALSLGSASFTHLRAALERVKPGLDRVREACVDDDAVRGELVFSHAVLSGACTYWRDAAQWAAFSVRLLVETGAVPDRTVVIRWLASELCELQGWWAVREIEDLVVAAQSRGEDVGRPMSESERGGIADRDDAEAMRAWAARRNLLSP